MRHFFVEVKTKLHIILEPDADIEEVLESMKQDITVSDGGSVVDTEILEWEQMEDDTI